MSWISGVDIGPLEARLRNLLRDEPLPEEWSKELTPREEANHLVVWSYRNGPIEDVHGGKWSVGSELPGFKRLYATDVVRVARFARRRLAWHLAARDQLDPTLRSIVLRAKAFGSADGWSVSNETTAVRFPGLPGLGPLDTRLRWLAERWPAAYSGTANLG